MALKMCRGVIALLRLSSQVVAQSYSTSSEFKACDALFDAGLGDILVFPTNIAYTESTSTYYSSENRRLRPYCIVQPRSTEDDSFAIKALGSVSSAGNWDIAVRSGGHSDYDNNAAHRGVTIDLTFFNSTELVKSGCFNGTADWRGQSVLTNSIAQIRPAARWGNVMTYLETYNLGVTGYEVVLANGSMVEATAEENADLLKALEGGGSNLGIVTRFDVRTFTVPPSGAYGGLIFASWSDLDIIINHSIGSGNPDHESVVYRSDAGNLAVMAMAVSTDGNENSTTFAPFKDITLTRDMRFKQPLSKIAATIADTGGSHYIPFSLSLQATPEIMEKAADIFVALTQELDATSVPVSVNFVFQPLPKNLASVKPGNNILGFEKNLPADSILFEARGTLVDTDVEYGGIVESMMGRAIEELRAYSASFEGHSTFLYVNYADPEQDVIGSYGAESVRLLKDTAAKYDLAGFFQRRIPGG
ncbi:FAD binding domain-containing protein [Colletotrichum godetiae]|uniref:FAD binding domain-containing protein n=1 Tax=Colletotrichum godetiae TaxID=1209918 RepID=A0AAJ0A883_9PEZI|nr:FAD binding domain-containing protein [Colletotrichum godetiae]KAK1658344.1 FAD binding domain-containing protein [Colletotrichum godetiae]